MERVDPRSGKILCVGLNYEGHRKETGRALMAHPAIFTRFADPLTAHRAPRGDLDAGGVGPARL